MVAKCYPGINVAKFSDIRLIVEGKTRKNSPEFGYSIRCHILKTSNSYGRPNIDNGELLHSPRLSYFERQECDSQSEFDMIAVCNSTKWLNF